MDSIADISYQYLTLSTNVRCHIKRVIDYDIVFQQDSAAVHLAFSTVELLQCKTVNFPATVENLTYIKYKLSFLNLRAT